MSIRIGKDGRIIRGSNTEAPLPQSTSEPIGQGGFEIPSGSDARTPARRNNNASGIIILALLFVFIIWGISSFADTQQHINPGSSSINTRQQQVSGSSNSNIRQQQALGSSNTNARQQPVFGVISPQNTNSRVRLRSGPAVREGNIVRSLSHGDRVEILGHRTVGNDRWAHVNYNGQRGYVHSSLIRTSQPSASNNNTSAAANRNNNTNVAVNRNRNNNTNVAANRNNNNNPQNSVSSSNTQSTRRYFDAGLEAWQRQDWQAAYNAFERAYQIDRSSETRVRRDNALHNFRAIEAAAQQERAHQQILENQRQLEMRQQQAQREADEQRRREEENHRIAENQRRRQQRNEAARGVLGLGLHILNERNRR